jgi:AP-3 complex subunit beta
VERSSTTQIAGLHHLNSEMSFSLGFDEAPNSYQASGNEGGYSGGGSWGESIGSLSAGEEAYSTSFSPHASGGPTTSLSTELKNMLESSKDGLKLEAMKRLITMIAKGKSETVCRSLFPSVVKCVVCKNPEVRKLVYAYLVRFGESEPDLALLSVSTFQRSLKDPNPLIRGSALRVLASIRVPVIAPLILSAIKESSHDMSPYVRKTAALSIPKLLALDSEQKEEAITLIEMLLKDRTTHVLGSVVASFTQVCPDRLDLLHPHYRKFVSLLPDFDEWGQVILIQLLTNYARTQFLDPVRTLGKKIERENQLRNNKKTTKSSSGDSEEESESEEEEDQGDDLDMDLKMLLKNCRPLLQSRNSAVVFSVLQLHLAIFFPNDSGNKTTHANSEEANRTNDNIEANDEGSNSHEQTQNTQDSSLLQASLVQEYLVPCFKPLVRLIASSHREIQQLVLSSIVSLTSRNLLSKSFEPYLRSFFVKSKDPVQVKLLKLQVLTNLSTSGNIALILREFQAYVNTYSSDAGTNESESSLFVSSVITAIGNVATRIREVAEVCLKGLIALLSNRSNESIVAQAVIVIRTQIMNREREAKAAHNGFLDSTESNSSVGSITDSSEVTALIIKQLVNSKLMDSDPTESGIKDKSGKTAWSKARGTILWILAEFCNKNLKAYTLSPDVLRRFAKSFPQESDLVKLQILNLAAKMSLVTQDNFILPFLAGSTDTKETLFDRQRFNLLVTYIFNLAKYDLNYDIRDRARFLKSLMAMGVVVPQQEETENTEGKMEAKTSSDFETIRSVLFDKRHDIHSIESDSNGIDSQDRSRRYKRKKFVGESRFRVGTLSHFLDHEASGYEDLPPFPQVAPDPSLRNPPPEPVKVISPPSSISGRSASHTGRLDVTRGPATSSVKAKKEKFYSDDETEEESSEEETTEDSDEDETSDEESEEEGDQTTKNKEETEEDDDGEQEDSSEEESSDETESEEESSSEEVKPKASDKLRFNLS